MALGPQPKAATIPPEPRTLLASQGAILKFVAGVPIVSKRHWLRYFTSCNSG
jgi:hypothetical protein